VGSAEEQPARDTLNATDYSQSAAFD